MGLVTDALKETCRATRSVRELLSAILVADCDHATALRREIAMAASHLATAELLLDAAAHRMSDDDHTGEAA